MHLSESEYDELLSRVAPEVCEAWVDFIRDGGNCKVLSDTAWLRLYELSVAAYRATWGGRWRTSEVALLAIHDGCARPGDLAVAYTHCIFALAVADGRPIFGDGMLT